MATDEHASIAYYITPHGFGHAARSCAVMSAIQERKPSTHFKIFTRVPQWFFEQSGVTNFTYNSLQTDVGLVQDSAMHENLAATVKELNNHLPYRLGILDELAQLISDCICVICDVSTMGISVAEVAGIPSVLIENFTWDWIYEQYASRASGMRRHAGYLRSIRQQASFLIQIQPNCRMRRNDLVTNPVSRKFKTQPKDMRAHLGIADETKFIPITMGGCKGDFPFLNELKRYKNVTFLIPGGADQWIHDENLILCPMNSELYHPDIINAADAAICKAGYSTVAEAYHGGTPIGYVMRETFPESPAFKEFIPQHMHGYEISCSDWENGSWTGRIPSLLEMSRIERAEPNGADQIVDFLSERLKI